MIKSFNRLLDHPEALCNMVKRIAVEAGQATLSYFDESGFIGTQIKDDGSPVTAADQAAEKIIEDSLYKLLPDVPVIGEEAFSEGRIPDISQSDYFWLVDPLDGTKEFITGSGDYTVNIALIHHNMPVIGVVYAPAKGELYAGHGLNTATCYKEDSGKEKEIFTRTPPKDGMTIMASAHHGDQRKLDEFLKDYKIAKLLKRGSSLKICMVAAGKADIYPRFGTTCEWDIAAGDAVLRAAGGIITDVQGQDFRYGFYDRKFRNPEFVACSRILADDRMKMMEF